MINKIQTDLIELLHDQKHASSNYLAKSLSVSKRTVISYVKKINEIHPSLILSDSKGYYLNHEVYSQIIKQYPVSNIQEPSERIAYMIRQLLTGYQDSINIVEMSYQLYFSETTVRFDIYKIKEIAKDYDLQINFNYNTVSVSGSEIKKREFLFYTLFDDTDKNIFYDLDTIRSAFPEFDIDKIHRYLFECLEKHHYTISDYALINLLVHIIISMNRISHNHIIDKELYMKFVRRHDLEIAEEITNKLGKSFRITFPEIEIKRTALIIAAIISEYGNIELSIENIDVWLWKSCHELIIRLVNDLNEIYNIRLDINSDNFISFALHIRSLIHRSTAGINIKNPFLKDIKYFHPIVFDCAVYVADTIQKTYPIEVDEDEIAYLAMHINSISDSESFPAEKIRVLFVLPKYSVNQDLYRFYKEQFDKYIISKCIFNMDDKQDLNSYDLIISTSKLPRIQSSAQFLVISPIRSDAERKKVFHAIEHIQNIKRQQEIRNILQEVLDEGRFYRNDEENPDQITILNQMVAPLLEEGIVPNSYVQDILDREKLSDTSNGIICIPHSIAMLGKKTTMSVMILNNPMPWGDNMIRIILLFTMAPDRYFKSKKFLAFLYEKMLDKPFSRKLSQCGSCKEFIDLLVQGK